MSTGRHEKRRWGSFLVLGGEGTGTAAFFDRDPTQFVSPGDAANRGREVLVG